MSRENRRKLFRQGHSMAVVIPAYTVGDMGLREGDDMEFVMEVRRGEKVLELRKVEPVLGTGV